MNFTKEQREAIRTIFDGHTRTERSIARYLFSALDDLDEKDKEIASLKREKQRMDHRRLEQKGRRL